MDILTSTKSTRSIGSTRSTVHSSSGMGRKRYKEGGTLAFFTLQPNPSIVRHDDLLDNRQAQPRRALPRCRCDTGSLKRLKQLLYLSFGDSFAMIFATQDDFRAK